MSESSAEPKAPSTEPHTHTKTPTKGGGDSTKNILTKDYGPLKGWVWVIILGGTIYLILVIRKKKAAASTSSATTTADTTTSTGTSSDSGTSSDNGGSAGGYYGGGSGWSDMPIGSLNPPTTNAGSTTGTSPHTPGFVVLTTVDEGLAKNDGVPLADLFLGSGTPKAGYTKPTDLAADPGLPGEVYLGQASGPGTQITGATRTETDAQLKQYLAQHPITGT